MKKLLVIDNYDSFTYNLVQLLAEIGGGSPKVIRNDKLELSDVEFYEKILLSPGPGIPSEAGFMPEIVRRFSAQKSILGVCLGHQCIAEVFGGKLRNMNVPVHGKTCLTRLTGQKDKLFEGLPTEFITGRYHSWVVDRLDLPADIVVTAEDEKGEIMAISHRVFDVKGVQFHPESVMTDSGRQILSNWLNK